MSPEIEQQMTAQAPTTANDGADGAKQIQRRLLCNRSNENADAGRRYGKMQMDNKYDGTSMKDDWLEMKWCKISNKVAEL